MGWSHSFVKLGRFAPACTPQLPRAMKLGVPSGVGRVMRTAFGRLQGHGGLPQQAAMVVVAVMGVAGCSNSSQRTQPVASWQPTAVERNTSLPTVPGQPPASPQTFTPSGQVPVVAGAYKVGKPYVINGVTYVPQHDPHYNHVGVASWYGTEFHARKTANGELFDMGRLTAAHPTLPMPSYVYVTNLKNGRTILVRVNDRGPYKPGRIIDVSKRTAQLLGFDTHGTTEVRVRYGGPAPLDPADDRRERQHLATQPWNRYARTGQQGWFGLGMGSTAADR